MLRNNLINDILENTYNGKTREVIPISDDDKKNIVQLNETEAIILWDAYFSETVKYALLFERTYDEPIMTEIFDESEINTNILKKTLKSMHSDETPILLYWSMNVAVETTWGIFTKYWDNFFYSAGNEAIIYVDQEDVYIYTDMIVRKINKIKSISNMSAFNYLQNIRDEKITKLNVIENLLNGDLSSLQDDIYLVLRHICEGLLVIENDELRKEYLDYYKWKIWTNTTNVILVSKPYSEESKRDYYKFLEDKWSNLQKDNFNELLMKIIKQKLTSSKD